MMSTWAFVLVLFFAACATGQPAALRSAGSPVSNDTAVGAVSPVGAALRSDPFEEQASAELAAPMRHGGHGMQMGGAEESESPGTTQSSPEQAHEHGEASP